MPLRRGPKKSLGSWTSMEMGNWTAMNSSKEKIASVLHKRPKHRALAIMEISLVVICKPANWFSNEKSSIMLNSLWKKPRCLQNSKCVYDVKLCVVVALWRLHGGCRLGLTPKLRRDGLRTEEMSLEKTAKLSLILNSNPSLYHPHIYEKRGLSPMSIHNLQDSCSQEAPSMFTITHFVLSWGRYFAFCVQREWR